MNIKNIIKILFHKFKQPKSRIASSSNVSLNTVINEKVKILEHCSIGSCEIGRYTYIGNNCVFERTQIGSFTSIGAQVICGMGSHPLNLISTYPGFYTKEATGAEWLGNLIDYNDKKTTTIGSDVWIGIRAIIISGISVGHGSVIAAGSVVTKDVPPYAIVGGVPAKIIRYRFKPEDIEKLLILKWWEFPIYSITSAAKYCQNTDLFIENLKF